MTAEGDALPREFGGDGLGPADIGREVEAVDPYHPDIQRAAERIKAQLRGIDPDHPLLMRRPDTDLDVPIAAPEESPGG